MQESETMSGYRRFIAYVYEYPQGKKGEGKGFIKVESRDGICRMRYKLAGIYGRGSMPASVFGYVRQEEECRGILLGTCNLEGGTVEFEHQLEEENLNGSGQSLDALCGLILLTESGEMYGSGWDDKPLHLKEIRLPKDLQEEEQDVDQEEEMPEPEVGMETEEPKREEEREAGKEELLSDGWKEEWTRKNQMESCAGRTSSAPKEEREYRKVRPGELNRLSRRDRGLSNNQFVRRGFCRYGYLILGQKKEDGRCFLGVPGIYEQQECLMANMYGFPYFQETSDMGKHGGRQGYWYRFIDQPDLSETRKE